MDPTAHQSACDSPGPIRSWHAERSALIARHDQALTRIDAPAADILRVRCAPAGRLAARRSWDPAAELPGAALSVQEDGARLRLWLSGMTASLALDSGALALTAPGGARLCADLAGARWRTAGPAEVADWTQTGDAADPACGAAALPARTARTAIWVEKRLEPADRLFGGGQRTGASDRRGRRLAHWTLDPNCPGLEVRDGALYQAHPVLMAVRPGLAWGLYLHSSWYSHFDAGAADADVLSLLTLGGELDYFVFAGPTPAAVVEQLTRLTGRPALPPLWALGYHQSRWGYRTAAEVQALARGFRTRGIPLDAIHLDIDHMDDYRVFTWHPERFPDPAGTLDSLHAQGIRTVTIVDPGVKRDGAGRIAPPGCGQAAADTPNGEPGALRPYAVAAEGLRGEHFVRTADGRLFSGYVWPGESLFPDFCRSATRDWWGRLHAAPLTQGVDGIWCDMNEPAIVDQPFHSSGVRARPIPLDSPQGDGGESVHAEAHNLYGQLMARATHEGLRRLRPHRRPWVLTRSGGVGVQRWAASWMGDNASTWADLRTSLAQLAGMGLSGSPHVGADIGGFYGDADGELYARWIELGAFYPFMRTHCHHASRPQEPWAFGPEVERIAREAIRLRYRLLPYLYSLAHRAAGSGEPLLRPLLFDFPDEAPLHGVEDQLMIGPWLMIAPVCAPGVARRSVRLPPGRWFDWRSGRPVAGAGAAGGTVELAAPPGAMPILARAGGCIPLANPRPSSAEPVTELTLDAYPDPAGSNPWTLIEDAGDGDDEPATTALETAFAPDGAELRVGARRGPWRPPPRQLRLRLHLPARPAALWWDTAAAAGWHWDAARGAAVLVRPDDGCAHRLRAI